MVAPHSVGSKPEEATRHLPKKKIMTVAMGVLVPCLVADPETGAGWLLHGGVIPNYVFKLTPKGYRITMATTEYMLLYTRKCDDGTEVSEGIEIDMTNAVRAPRLMER